LTWPNGIWLLTLYHLALFRRFYFQNPYCYATSEALEQGYASFLHLGRELRQGHLVPHDPYYYPDFASLPFLSSFYPPHMAAAWLASFCTLNQAWILYVFTMVSHCWLASVSVYILVTNMGLAPLPAGFASLTLSNLGYAMKQNSSIIYTASWVPLFLLASIAYWPMSYGISLGLMLLAGYWPISLPATVLGILLWVINLSLLIVY